MKRAKQNKVKSHSVSRKIIEESRQGVRREGEERIGPNKYAKFLSVLRVLLIQISDADDDTMRREQLL